MDAPRKATLIYSPAIVRRRILGRDGTNAMDYVTTIDCWQLVYRVEGRYDIVMLDAYTGEQLRHLSKRSID